MKGTGNGAFFVCLKLEASIFDNFIDLGRDTLVAFLLSLGLGWGMVLVLD
jgi:hypothetical protein